MHEALKAILERTERELNAKKEWVERETKEALLLIDEAKGRMEGLVQFAEQLPVEVLSKFNHVGIAYVEVRGELHEIRLRAYQGGIGGQVDVLVDGLYGKAEPGKYRAIVILQRMGDIE